MTSSEEYWRSIAERWAQIGPPLRPSSQDLDAFQESIREIQPRSALILGVTPELQGLTYPPNANIFALDHTEGMIRSIWPGPLSRAVHGSWRAMPFADESFDVILCDGGFHLIDHPSGQKEFVGHLFRCIKPGGCFVLRLFSQPCIAETPSEVFAALDTGEIGSMNHLKLRLAMAMQSSVDDGIAVSQVWDAVNDRYPGLQPLAEKLQWPLEQTLALNAYRGTQNRYFFSTTDDLISMICKFGRFQKEAITIPTYDLGERCPTIRFRRA